MNYKDKKIADLITQEEYVDEHSKELVMRTSFTVSVVERVPLNERLQRNKLEWADFIDSIKWEQGMKVKQSLVDILIGGE